VKAHELFVRDLQASGMPCTVIRPTGFFSDMGMFFSMARSGHMFMLGDSKNRINPIHGADLAKFCGDVVEGGEREIGVGGPDTCSFNETVTMAFNALRKNQWISQIPMRVGDAALFLTGFFNKGLAEVMSFAIAVSGMDTVATATGTRHLGDFYRELASRE